MPLLPYCLHRHSLKGERKETEPLHQSGKCEKSDWEKTSRKRKRRKSRAGSPSPEPNKNLKKDNKHRKRRRHYLLQKTLRPTVVTQPLQRVEKAKTENWQKLKGFMWWYRKTLTNMAFLLI